MKRIVTFSEEKPKPQSFDQNIKFKKFGKEIKIQDYINESAEDVNIDTILKNYGAIPKESINTEEVITDLTQIQNLRDLEDKRVKVKNIFYSLPAEIRKQYFKDDVYFFEQNGLTFFENEQRKKIEAINKALEEQKKKQEEIKNGDKK